MLLATWNGATVLGNLMCWTGHNNYYDLPSQASGGHYVWPPPMELDLE